MAVFTLSVDLDDALLENHAKNLVDDGWAVGLCPDEVRKVLEKWLEDCVWELARDAAQHVTEVGGFNQQRFETLLERERNDYPNRP